jgi:hypothetical protein
MIFPRKKPEGKRWEDDIEIEFKGMESKDVNLIHVERDRDQWCFPYNVRSFLTC